MALCQFAVDLGKAVHVNYHAQWIVSEFILGHHLKQANKQTLLSNTTDVFSLTHVTGSQVYVVGHALIGPGASMLPSVTTGVMSKVATIGNQPVMLQVSCSYCKT